MLLCMWIITYGPLKTDKKKNLELKNEGVPYFQENSKKMVNSGFFWIAGSYGWNVKYWSYKIGDIDGYASVAFILSSSLYTQLLCLVGTNFTKEVSSDRLTSCPGDGFSLLSAKHNGNQRLTLTLLVLWFVKAPLKNLIVSEKKKDEENRTVKG